MESAPFAGGAFSCMRTFVPGVSAVRQAVQCDGSGPGLVVEAERLAGERLEVLGEFPFGERLQGNPAQVLGALPIPGTT